MLSRSDDGQITFREWRPVGVEEYGYVAPDPLDPDIVYGGKVTRYDRRTHDVQNVGPRPLRGRRLLHRAHGARSCSRRSIPRTLYFASNTLWKTTDGGPHLGADLPGPHADRLRRAAQRREVARHARGDAATTGA